MRRSLFASILMTACLLILQTSLSFAQSGDVVISSNTSWASGTYQLDSLTVTNNAKLTLRGANGQGVTIVASSLQVDSGSSISADGQGYGTGLGPGGSASYATGASYGGVGSNASASTTYGSYLAPTDLGSGGGGAYGGWSVGGGAIRLIVSGTLTNNGTITANGMTSTGGNTGGASGGSIYITAGEIVGNGAIAANGNQGSNAQGGGGRVAIYVTYNTGFGLLTTTANGGGANATAGSVYILENNVNLYVPTNLAFPADTTASYGNISVFNGALFTLGGGSSITVSQDLLVTGDSTILILSKNNTAQVSGQWQGAGVTISANYMQIDSGSKISADGQGYGTALGPGGSTGYTTGGSYGGVASGGGASIYGSYLAPTDLGSGGGGAYGGWSAGGGAIHLIVSSTLANNGTITANGMTSAGGNNGGGSGGSIYITADMIGGNGTITANGNQGSNAQGGGGRIAIYCTFSSGLDFTLVTADGGGANATAGSVYILENNANLYVPTDLYLPADTMASYANITVFNGALYTLGGGSNITVSQALTVMDNSTILILSKNNTAQVSGKWQGTGVTINANDIQIDAGSKISADGQGYGTGLGPGGSADYATGGSYGGRGSGGSASTYGSALAPTDLGSGGGGAYGGWSVGGGAIRLIASSTLTNNGTITANGITSTSGNTGGASGGSIYLTTGTITGNGTITANGNQGSNAQGGGGRIAIFYASDTFSGTITVSKGGASAGDGTVTATFLPEGSSVDLDLNTGGAAVSSTAGSSSTTQIGYASLTVNSGEAPYGTAVFSFVQTAATVTEAGVPASPPTTSARIFVDYRSDVDAVPARGNSGTININTGIAVVNPGAAAANVTYTLRDIAGSILATGNGTIAAGAHFAKFIDQLTDVAPNFSLPSNFQNTTKFGTLEIASSQPLSVLALRGTNNQRNDFLITTTPVADLTQSLGNSSSYFPQFVDGGGYTTSLVLLNTSTAVETGTLEILDDNGTPLSIQPVGITAGSSFQYSIQPNGAFRLQTDGSPIDFNKGWVRLTPDPGTSTPIGSGIFAYNPVDMLLSESGIPAAVSTTHARIYLDLSGSHNTGLAIANIANANADIAINAFQMDGVTAIGTSQGPLPLPANGHDAKFVDQFITGLPTGFTGVLDISSTTPFAALTIRSLLNERHDFLMTTFPIADANAAAPSPIVFPQVADGGGYVTQFIFISPSGASSAILNFWDEGGAPLAIGP